MWQEKKKQIIQIKKKNKSQTEQLSENKKINQYRIKMQFKNGLKNKK